MGGRRQKPYQRSLQKKTWPLISPARGALVSPLSLALTRAWPVFHMVGLPPRSLIQPARLQVHLTS